MSMDEIEGLARKIKNDGDEGILVITQNNTNE